MKLRKIALVPLALLLPLSAAACSKDSTADLSLGKISTELQKGGLPKDQADCIAKVLKKADFTESDLKEIAANPSSTKGKAYIAAATKCITADVPQ